MEYDGYGRTNYYERYYRINHWGRAMATCANVPAKQKLNFRRKRDATIKCSFQERTLVRQGLFSFKLIAKIAAYIMEGYTHFGILKGELLC